jgi:hypothetical protein
LIFKDNILHKVFKPVVAVPGVEAVRAVRVRVVRSPVDTRSLIRLQKSK